MPAGFGYQAEIVSADEEKDLVGQGAGIRLLFSQAYAVTVRSVASSPIRAPQKR
jgi:hypothetical protein